VREETGLRPLRKTVTNQPDVIFPWSDMPRGKVHQLGKDVLQVVRLGHVLRGNCFNC
jgi:hypothetical protein